MRVNEAARLADQLIGALSSAGVRATRLATSMDVAGITHSGFGGSLLVHVVLITTGGMGVHDFAWGPSFENTLPIDTPVALVASAIVATLGLPPGGRARPWGWAV